MRRVWTLLVRTRALFIVSAKRNKYNLQARKWTSEDYIYEKDVPTLKKETQQWSWIQGQNEDPQRPRRFS